MTKSSFIILSVLLASATTIFAFSPIAIPTTTICRPTSKNGGMSFKKSFEPLKAQDDDTTNSAPTNEEIEARLEEFKKQNQIKAFAVLAVAFGAFVYFKLQYDADPTNFIGSTN